VCLWLVLFQGGGHIEGHTSPLSRRPASPWPAERHKETKGNSQRAEKEEEQQQLVDKKRWGRGGGGEEEQKEWASERIMLNRETLVFRNCYITTGPLFRVMWQIQCHKIHVLHLWNILYDMYPSRFPSRLTSWSATSSSSRSERHRKMQRSKIWACAWRREREILIFLMDEKLHCFPWEILNIKPREASKTSERRRARPAIFG